MGSGPIAGALVAHQYGPMRRMLRMALEEAGYAVAEASSYDDALRHLRAAGPTVVVAGNAAADYRAEEAFFRQVAADPALAARHHFVLLTTIAEWLPPALDATLRAQGVRVLRMPFRLYELVAAVEAAAGRPRVKGEGEGSRRMREGLSAAEAARRLDVSERTVRRWIEQGRLRARRSRDNTFAIDPADLGPDSARVAGAHPRERVARLEARLHVLEGRAAMLEARLGLLDTRVAALESRPNATGDGAAG